MILIDSHIVIWLGYEPERLSARANAAIAEERRAQQRLAICSMTLYELSLKARRGQLPVDRPVEQLVSEIEREFTLLPLNAQIAIEATAFPKSYPRDPMDRLVGATANVHGLELITADDRIRRSGLVRTIW